MPAEAETAEPFLPRERGLPQLRAAAETCRGCALYERATQTVFGAGPASAEIVLVGEQPGDREDLEGRPFVGPAGRILFRALDDLGIARDEVYVTNAVKHFKWTAKGKRRIHQTPRASEVRACLPWLDAEIALIRPRLIACLGATAVEALLGPRARVIQDRGRVLESGHGACLITVHPSSVLRAQGEAGRRAAYDAFLADLRRGVEFLRRSA